MTLWQRMDYKKLANYLLDRGKIRFEAPAGRGVYSFKRERRKILVENSVARHTGADEWRWEYKFFREFVKALSETNHCGAWLGKRWSRRFLKKVFTNPS